ncbi:MAG TPA: helix-turn-helix domain-containing protein [Thermoleophilaceae bacterium]
MAAKRTYGDSCGIARALDVVGDRWALLVVRELLLGPKRFTDLREGLRGLSADVLAQRLRELERSGIVRRRKLAPPAGSRVYELTEWGSALEPVILELGRWGSRAPFPDGQPELGPDAAVLALKTLFDPSAADGLDATYELHLGEHGYRVRVSRRRLEISRGEARSGDAAALGRSGDAAPKRDAAIRTDPATFAAVLWHGRRLTDALRSGDLEYDGSRPAVARFVELFPLPDPVPAP